MNFPKNAQLCSWDWNGGEREGGACCSDAGVSIDKDDGSGVTGNWLAPGLEAVYRVELPD